MDIRVGPITHMYVPPPQYRPDVTIRQVRVRQGTILSISSVVNREGNNVFGRRRYHCDCCPRVFNSTVIAVPDVIHSNGQSWFTY